MSKKLWVGLDVGEREMVVCIVNAEGVRVREEVLPTSTSALDTLLRSMRRGNIAVVAMEAGSTSTRLARGLENLNYDVAVFETRQLSTYLGMRQNKTDRNDARGIAEVARTGRGTISEVLVKSSECQRVRSLLAMRQNFVRMRVSGEAGLRGLLQLYGGKLGHSATAKMLRRNVSAEIARVKKEEKIDLREEAEPMLRICEAMRLHLEGLSKKLTAMANANPVCRLFMEIPGVGPLTALSFYSAIDDPFRFDRNEDVGPYLGLVPRIRQSGATIARLRISKTGNNMTRSHLTSAAKTHLGKRSKDTRLKTWGLKVRERRGAGKANVAVARKLAVMMLAMWKRSTPFDPEFVTPASVESSALAP